MIAIYEPIYATGQRLTNSAFIPLDRIANNNSDWREFGILVDFYRAGQHQQHTASGIMSPKFELKTGVSGSSFITFVESNPAADVWFVNPFPQLGYISFNIWKQGEISHPGLVERAKALLSACRIELEIDTDTRHGPDVLCYSNFWAGSPQFWGDYVGGILEKIAIFLVQNSDHPAAKDVLEGTRHTDPTPFLPFIVERLFTSYLQAHPSLRKASLQLSPEGTAINDFEVECVRALRPAVDAADRAGEFSEELRQFMDLTLRLRRLYTTAAYTNNPHPHSGRSIPSFQK